MGRGVHKQRDPIDSRRLAVLRAYGILEAAADRVADPWSKRAAVLEAMAASGVATGILDLEGRYSWWSAEAADRFGWTSGEVIGRRPEDFLFDDEGDVATGEADLRLAQHQRWHGLVRARKSDGEAITAQAFAVALQGDDGGIESYLTGIVDADAASTGTNPGLVESVLLRSEDAVLLCDGPLHGDGPRILYANPSACAGIGLSLVELVGRPVAYLIDHEADRKRLADVWAELASGQAVRDEFDIATADGRSLMAEVELTPFGDGSGAVSQVAVIVHDISKRRAADEAHAASERRLRAASELAGVGAWEIDFRSGEVMWDGRVRELLGLPADAPATVDAWYGALGKVDRIVDQRRLHEINSDSDSDALEAAYRVVRADGSERWLLTRGRVSESDDDGPRRMLGVLLDVTDSHAAADLVTATIESMSEGYYAIDRQWRFTYLNRWAEEMLGVSHDDLVGRDAKKAFPEAVGTVIERSYEQAMAGATVEFEVFFEPHDRWYEVSAYPQPDGIAVHFRDVSARRREQAEREALLSAAQAARAELAHAAAHDPLTGLPNRVELRSWLTAALTVPDRTHPVNVLFCDIDRFKVVNDSLGHAAGDELLVVVAQRIIKRMRPGDIVARLGGDEFVVALSSASATEAEAVGTRLLEAFREPMIVADRRLVVSASIGIAQAEPGDTAETLLRDADAALYLAKGSGRDRLARFDERLRSAVVARLQTEHELRDAVAGDQLRLHFQPAFDLRTGEPTGAEALLRWAHPTRGLLTAGAFIDLAEDTGLVSSLSDWVVPTACAAALAWTGDMGGLMVWVNVSVHQLMQPGFARSLLCQIVTGGGSTDTIGVEVTESALTEDHSTVIKELAELSAAGVRIAIDDFGTGYSSLARLRRFPVDVLKLDQAFVADVSTGAGRAVAAAVVDLAHAVDAVALAEGVETADQLEIVRDLGCDWASGFYLARPVPAEALAAAVLAAPIRAVDGRPNRAHPEA